MSALKSKLRMELFSEAKAHWAAQHRQVFCQVSLFVWLCFVYLCLAWRGVPRGQRTNQREGRRSGSTALMCCCCCCWLLCFFVGAGTSLFHEYAYVQMLHLCGWMHYRSMDAHTGLYAQVFTCKHCNSKSGPHSSSFGLPRPCGGPTKSARTCNDLIVTSHTAIEPRAG